MVDIKKIRFINEYNPGKGGTLCESVPKQGLNMWNGHVVLMHDSNNRITNGVIDRTGQTANNYSKNSDLGNYFWASPNPGKDQSNGGQYTYYCLISPDNLYDMEENPKGYDSTKDALQSETYVAGRWNDGAIAVMTNQPTPISFIEAKNTNTTLGGIYDAKWHLLRSKVVFYNKQRNLEIAKRMKPFQNVEVPEFLGGYDYNSVISAPTY